MVGVTGSIPVAPTILIVAEDGRLTTEDERTDARNRLVLCPPAPDTATSAMDRTQDQPDEKMTNPALKAGYVIDRRGHDPKKS
jgi:hypothetical protein